MRTVHSHAYKRAIERFGIMPKEANKWVNARFKESTFLEFQEDGRKRFIHPTEPIFIVTTDDEQLIVSIIDKPIDHVPMKTPFLDGMIETLHREYEKMRRSYRVQARDMDAKIAEMTLTLGNTLKKRARVYNPTTQGILQSQADELQAQIAAMKDEAKELKRQYELSSLKVRGFLRTAAGEPR